MVEIVNPQDAVRGGGDGVHAAHCCAKRGCKYAHTDCREMDAQEENETVDQIIAWLLERVRQISGTEYPDEESALSMEQRAHHYEDVVEGIRSREWKR